MRMHDERDVGRTVCSRQVPSMYRLSISYLSAIYQLSISYLSAVYQLYITPFVSNTHDSSRLACRDATRGKTWRTPHKTWRISRPQDIAHLTPTPLTLLQLLVATPSCNTFHEIFCPQHFLGGAEMKQQGDDEGIGGWGLPPTSKALEVACWAPGGAASFRAHLRSSEWEAARVEYCTSHSTNPPDTCPLALSCHANHMPGTILGKRPGTPSCTTA